MQQSHEDVVIIRTIELATVPFDSLTPKPEPLVESDRDSISREDLKLDAFYAKTMRLGDGLFGESSAVTAAAIGWKQAHAQAADVPKSVKLGSNDIAPSHHVISVRNGNELNAAAGEEVAYKRGASFDWRADKKG
ncbi:MAG TPA: hypothetical protein PKD61_23300 [Polyangiaceae bacterium]|nr:hypothetical protein [Polyangiaceae bacterium]